MRPRLASAATRRGFQFAAFFAISATWGAAVLSIHLGTGSPVSDLVLAAPGPIIERYGPGDAGSYLALAVDLSRGQVTPENEWVLRLWPPGMAGLEAALLLLPGSILPKLAVLAIMTWSATGAAVATTILRRGRRALAVGFIAAWLLSAPATGWVLHRGFTYSDGIGACLMVGGVLCAFLAFAPGPSGDRRRLKFIALSGVLVGLSMYFRWALAGAVAGLTVYALAVAAGLAVAAVARPRRGSPPGRPRAGARGMAAGLLFALGVLVPVAPWTAFVATALHPGDLTWSKGEYQWAQRWLTDEQLSDAQFLVVGNANWACEVAPSECETTYNDIAVSATEEDFEDLQRAALQQIVAYPLEYAANRTDMFFRGWFSTPTESFGSSAGIANGTFFTLVLGAFAWSCATRFRAAPAFIGGLIVAIAGMVAIIAVAHLEPRYLISIHTLLLAGAALLLTMPRSRRSHRASEGTSRWSTLSEAGREGADTADVAVAGRR